MTKLIVIGLDGATWEIINPLIESGKLPTIKNLLEISCHGKLESIVPPISVPAWKCYSTGKTPAKLGVYDFLKLNINEKKYELVTAKSYNSKDLWEYLNEYGVSCGVFKMFSTHPPKIIDKFMISDYPFIESAYHPVELHVELENLFGSLWIDIPFSTDKEKAISCSHEMIEREFKTASYLIDKFEPSFFHMSISSTDGIQHFYWDEFKNSDLKYGKTIENTWILVDKNIKMLLNTIEKKYGDDFHLVLMSDHGFYDVRGRFNTAAWLKSKNYLILNKKGTLYTYFFTYFFKSIEKVFSVFEYVVKLSRSLKIGSIKWGDQYKISGSLNENVIDWNKSKVIPLSGTTLYINRKLFNSPEKYELFRDSLIYDLQNIINPFSGEKMADKVYRSNELYKDGGIDVPDVVVLPNHVMMSFQPVVRHIWSKPKNSIWTGMHNLYGIFSINGPLIKKDHVIKNAKICDLAPTILNIFGVPVPSDMTGTILSDIYSEDATSTNTIYNVSLDHIKNGKKKIADKIKNLRKFDKL